MSRVHEALDCHRMSDEHTQDGFAVVVLHTFVIKASVPASPHCRGRRHGAGAVETPMQPLYILSCQHLLLLQLQPARTVLPSKADKATLH
jgi:hypothetical protein